MAWPKLAAIDCALVPPLCQFSKGLLAGAHHQPAHAADKQSEVCSRAYLTIISHRTSIRTNHHLPAGRRGWALNEDGRLQIPQMEGAGPMKPPRRKFSAAFKARAPTGVSAGAGSGGALKNDSLR